MTVIYPNLQASNQPFGCIIQGHSKWVLVGWSWTAKDSRSELLPSITFITCTAAQCILGYAIDWNLSSNLIWKFPIILPNRLCGCQSSQKKRKKKDILIILGTRCSLFTLHSSDVLHQYNLRKHTPFLSNPQTCAITNSNQFLLAKKEKEIIANATLKWHLNKEELSKPDPKRVAIRQIQHCHGAAWHRARRLRAISQVLSRNSMIYIIFFIWILLRNCCS